MEASNDQKNGERPSGRSTLEASPLGVCQIWTSSKTGGFDKRAVDRGLKEILVALDHAAEREAVFGLRKKNLRLYFRVHGLGENFVERQPEQKRTQVVDVGDGTETGKFIRAVRRAS